MTSANPADPVPGAGPGIGDLTGAGNRSGSRTGIWLIAALAALVVTAIVAFLVLRGVGDQRFTPVPEDTNSATPTVTGWDETSRPTPPPTAAASVVDCPFTEVAGLSRQGLDGRLHGGGISADKISGWQEGNMYLQWVSDFHSQVDEVRPGWISNIGVGQLNTVDGFADPQTAARQTLECFATSGYYLGLTHRVDLLSEPATVDGFPAWRMRSEVHIQSSEMPEIEGDVVDIIVVDLGEPDRMGVFVSSATIGDSRRQALVDEAIASLTVD